MLAVKRQEYIVKLIKEQGSITVRELSDKLMVSPMTIRRDLNYLDQQNIVLRSHGGATLKQPADGELSFQVRQKENLEGKQAVARAALRYITPGQTVLLDAGTTAFQLALLLKQREGLTVLTPDLRIALELCDSQLRVFLLGGELQKEIASAYSSYSAEFVKGLHIDVAFLGASSVSERFAVYSPDHQKAELKRHFINNAEHTILLADRQKFFSQSLFKIAGPEKLRHIITDRSFSKEEMERLNGSGHRSKFIVTAVK